MQETRWRWIAGGLAVGWACLAGAADTVEEAQRVLWLSSVTDGVYSDAANWTGGELPANGIDGKYGLINFRSCDVTVRAPAGGLTENSGTIFFGGGATAHTLTLDTRGTFWEKKALKSVNDWWGSPFAIRLDGGHVFNFEGLNKVPEATVWKFQDALFTWTSTFQNAQRFDLHSGTFLFGRDLYLGSEGGAVDFVIHPEAQLLADGASFQQRGNARTTTTFLGGRHALQDLSLKDANSARGTTWVVLTNDAFVAVKGALQLGNRNSQNPSGRGRGVLDLYGTSRMDVTNGVYLGAGDKAIANLCNQGDLTLHDTATVYAHQNAYVGYTQCSTGVVTVADHAVLRTRETGASVYLGSTSNAVGRAVVQDDGQLLCGGVLRLGADGNGSTGFLTVKDRGYVTVGLQTGHWLTLGSGGGAAYGRLEMMDNAVLQLGGGSVELTLGGAQAKAEVVLSGQAQLLGSASTSVTNRSSTPGATSLALADQAVLSVRKIAGGDPATGEPSLLLSADGGILKVSGTTPPPVPYLSGCQATLGAGGLTLDADGRDVVLDQAFEATSAAATFTKAGTGTLTVRRNSTHPRTHVAAGCLAFAAGATRFGGTLDFAPGARLALPEEGCLAADAITFAGELYLEVPATFEPGADRAFLQLKTPLTADQLAHVVVVNAERGKTYAVSADADGTLRLAVAAAEAGAKTWVGASGASWRAAANWDPAAVPTANDDVTVAASTTIAVDGPAAAGTLAAGEGAAVKVAGEGPLQLVTGVDAAAGAAVELAAPVLGVGGTFEKSGPGELTVSGDNAVSMQSGWRLTGGRTVFASEAAFGADLADAAALALSNNTVRYAGAAPATVRRPLKLLGELPCVFDVAGDLTFADFKVSFAQKDAGLVKTGAGALTLAVPSGTTHLSVWGSAPRKGNADVVGAFAPSAAGEVTGWNGAGQLSVLDGRVAIVGAGKASSTVRQEHHGSIGGSAWKATAAPELYLKDVTFVQGSGSGFHMVMDQQTAVGSPASRLVLDNADMTCNGLYVGVNKVLGNAETVRPVLAVTNGTLNATWSLAIPSETAGLAPIVRVGAGGKISRVSGTTTGGLVFRRALDARFEDGGLLEVAAPQCFRFSSTATGEVVFARGGGMQVSRFLAQNTDTPAALVFDGGFAAFTGNDLVSAGTPAMTTLRAEAGGGELRVGAGVSHTLALPLVGEGTFTKTGAGTLVLTNDLKLTATTVAGVETYSFEETGATTPKLANAGGLAIAEGTVRCVAGAAPATARVSGVGTLSGAFTAFTVAVKPGATEGLTFSDLSVEKVTADFGQGDEAAGLPSGTRAVVATLGDGAPAFGAVAWRGAHAGKGRMVRITCEGQTVVATVTSGGTVLLLR